MIAARPVVMSLRSAPQPAKPVAALDYEIAQEQASALGRLGRALEAALAALADTTASIASLTAERAAAAAGCRRRAVVLHGPARGLRTCATHGPCFAIIACPPKCKTAWASCQPAPHRLDLSFDPTTSCRQSCRDCRVRTAVSIRLTRLGRPPDPRKALFTVLNALLPAIQRRGGGRSCNAYPSFT